MLNEDATAGETAIDYTNQFLDAAVKKIDKTFGKGFAAANPSIVQAYIHACALNLSSFMQASLALQAGSELDGLLSGLDESGER
jgi:hypothetical protein